MRKPLIILSLLLLSSCGFTPSGADRGSASADSTLQAINNNLELVNQKQGIVSVASKVAESISSIADNRRIQNRIEGNIVLIDSVMDDNRVRLVDLEKRLESHRRKTAELEQEISGMEQSIAMKQLEVDSLKRCLIRSGNIAASLNDSLRAGYVLAAPQDSLAKWKIIEKDRGFFGFLGSSWRLSGHIPLRRFARVNRLKTYKIAVPAKAGSYTVMTLHNKSSYTIAKHQGENRQGTDSSVIVIRNPQEFWEASHILVIKLPR
jgi:transcription antitermination factor NusG